MPDHLILVWYHENQWERWLSLDPLMCPTYSDWLGGAEQDLKKWQEKGLVVHRVYLDVDMLEAWAKARGLAVDGHARARCAEAILADRLGFKADL